jgi:hypothetical protein
MKRKTRRGSAERLLRGLRKNIRLLVLLTLGLLASHAQAVTGTYYVTTPAQYSHEASFKGFASGQALVYDYLFTVLGDSQGHFTVAGLTGNLSVHSLEILRGTTLVDTFYATRDRVNTGTVELDTFAASESFVARLSLTTRSGSTSATRKYTFEFSTAMAPPPVPEPAEWTMLLAGFLVLGVIARPRNRHFR